MKFAFCRGAQISATAVLVAAGPRGGGGRQWSRPGFCGRRFCFGGGGLVFGGGGIRGIHASVVLAGLLLERNDIREIHRWRSGDGALHEFEPNGKRGAC